jgi:hypothetical protein
MLWGIFDIDAEFGWAFGNLSHSISDGSQVSY